jgi:hypothetical protein
MQGLIIKRRHPRFQVPRGTVSYKTFGSMKLAMELSETGCPIFNLCKDGLCFCANNGLDPGRKLWLVVTFSGGKAPIRLKAHVIYCNPKEGPGHQYYVGVEFSAFTKSRRTNSVEAYKRLEWLENTYVPREVM